MPIISTSDTLQDWCRHVSPDDFLAIDTEFIREKTYYPRLCLIQAASRDSAVAIDPLAEGMDLTPLLALLADQRIVKVFHAARQDLEIFYHLMGKVPAPLFDTQIAAQFLGYGESIAYSDIVRRLLRVEIDKGSRYTDWSQRPLTEAQLNYALADVTHLREVYRKLLEQLAQKQRDEWITEEMQELENPALHAVIPEEAWKRLRHGHFKAKQLAGLRALAAWREREAQRRDIPRGRVLLDDTLVEIAAALPRNTEQLHQLRNIDKRHANAMLEAINQALEASPDSWPQPPARKVLPPWVKDAVQLLQMLLMLQCNKHDMLPRLVASRDELEAFALKQEDVHFQHGWRYDLFGREAEKLLRGDIDIGWDAAKQQISMRKVTG